MSKFKVGDRVRVVNNVVEKDRWVGEEFTITKINQPYLSFPIDVDNKNVGPFAENELEFVEQTPEEQLAELEQKVAELKQQIEDAKKVDFAALPVGSVVKSLYTYVKIGPNNWVSLKSKTRRSTLAPYSDADMSHNSTPTEVIREGI